MNSYVNVTKKMRGGEYKLLGGYDKVKRKKVTTYIMEVGAKSSFTKEETLYENFLKWERSREFIKTKYFFINYFNFIAYIVIR